MEEKRKKKTGLYVFIALIIAVLLGGGIYFAIKGKSQDVSAKETSKVITIEDFKRALNENGLTVTNENSKIASLIGATEGYGYTIGNDIIEVYKFDEKSDTDLTKNNIKSAKEKGIITMPEFNNASFNVKYNKGLVLSNYEQHPNKEKILEVFNSL